jgi:hypothetical protein
MKKILAITGIILAIMLGFNGVKNAQSYDCNGPTNIVAMNGDTMWAIAHRSCTGHVGNAVHNIIQLNGNTSLLQPGQVVYLPGRK